MLILISSAVDDNGEDRMAAWADGGANDICPPGFSVPTEAELAADVWDIDGTATALSSFLRIPTAGFRGHIHGALGNVGADANLWTRSVEGSKSYSQNHKFDLTEIERLYQQNYGESLF
jgi:hypothetical protein